MPGPAGEGKGASRDSMVKWSLRTRLRRASWTVWIVALLPEPWKARSVGLGFSEVDMVGGVLSVKKEVLEPGVAMRRGDGLAGVLVDGGRSSFVLSGIGYMILQCSCLLFCFCNEPDSGCAAGRVMLVKLARDRAPPSFSFCGGPIIGQSKCRLMLFSDRTCLGLFCSKSTEVRQVVRCAGLEM